MTEWQNHLREHLVEADRVQIEVLVGAGVAEAHAREVQPSVDVDACTPHTSFLKHLDDLRRNIAFPTAVDSGDRHEDAALNGHGASSIDDLFDDGFNVKANHSNIPFSWLTSRLSGRLLTIGYWHSIPPRSVAAGR